MTAGKTNKTFCSEVVLMGCVNVCFHGDRCMRARLAFYGQKRVLFVMKRQAAIFFWGDLARWCHEHARPRSGSRSIFRFGFQRAEGSATQFHCRVLRQFGIWRHRAVWINRSQNACFESDGGTRTNVHTLLRYGRSLHTVPKQFAHRLLLPTCRNAHQSA